MRLESDTYSQLSHRAPLYIDQYYRGQIGIVISLCAGGEKKREKWNLKYSTHIVQVLNTCNLTCTFAYLCVSGEKVKV